jgi:hypothetical protein
MRFSPEALDIFLRIEQPAAPGGPPQGEFCETLGQFYDAIEQGLRDLCARLGEAAVFSGDDSHQVTNEFYSGASGRVIVIRDLASALAALGEIVEQGEGTDDVDVFGPACDVADPNRRELAHYYRFMELRLGRRYRSGDTPASGPTGAAIAIDWSGVRPMRSNPHTREHPPGSPIRAAQDEFDTAYCEILALLDRAFTGTPQLLIDAVGAMYGLSDLAHTLTQIPTGGRLGMAGPTFEFVRPGRRARRVSITSGR